MAFPRLNFACEQDTPALQALFTDKEVINDLQALHASLSLGILDFSPERAQIVTEAEPGGCACGCLVAAAYGPGLLVPPG